MTEERRKLLADINKEFATRMGEEKAVICLGDPDTKFDYDVRPSGSLLLDLALGGGYGKGKLVVLTGQEKSGKTTLFNLAVAEAQINEPDKENCIIDLEQTWNPEWARKLGVDTDKIIVSQPSTYGENVYDLLEYLISTGKFAYIAVDSVDGIIPKEEFEETDWTKETRVGGASKLNSKAMRKIVYSGLLKKSGTTLIFIQQLRDKIGGFSMYGTPTDTVGGRSIKHACVQRLEVAQGEQFVKGTGATRQVIGQQIKVKLTKNKIGHPYTTATLDLYYDTGIDKISELVSVAKALGVLQGTNWLKFVDPTTGEVFTRGNEEIKFNGVAKAIEALKDDIQNGGELYAQMFTVVNKVIRR